MRVDYLTRKLTAVGAVALIGLPGLALAQNQALDPSWVESLQWREIGPAVMVGRIVDFAVDESDPATFYVGTASGGVWKTTTAGVTFEPLLQDMGSLWIGDIELSKSDPNIVWVGTGEDHPRNSVSYGDGIYKSTDGGETWTHMGLTETRHISKIAVHPTNPDIVYVGALGRMWGPNEERGLFKTVDGGRTWQKIHYMDQDTGVIDLGMSPTEPDTLVFATYETRRSLYDNIPNYDPEVKWSENSAIWRTTDGGRTFERLSGGLPTVKFGRVGLDIHQSNPDIMVAVIETEWVAMGKDQLEAAMKDLAAGQGAGEQYGRGTGERRPHSSAYGGQASNVQDEQGEFAFQTGGVFVTKDGGDNWTHVNSQNQRPMYFSQIRIDPTDPSYIFQLGLSASYSSDGGATFGGLGGATHGDHHAFWVDPANGKHVLLGNDGGVYQSWDRGQTWNYHSNIVASQFYHVTVDSKRPYTVYGGLQDNGSWGAPSRFRGNRGANNFDWFNVGGGDGFVVLTDPTDPDLVYAESQDGSMNRRNLRTGERASIRPARREGERIRFNWDTPMMLSHHNPWIFYTAGQYVFKSLNRGDDLQQISPDITRTERGSAVRLGESPLNPDVLWVGTDDGYVWVTRDGGENWTNVSGNIGAPFGFVSSIDCSRVEEGRAYLAIDTRRSDDLNAHVYVTEDFGATWTSLRANLPANNASHVLKEDLENPNVLYLGTHLGMYVSVNRGKHWVGMHNNMPTVTVHDIALPPTAGELVAGTHGRGIWIVDIAGIQQVDDQVLSAPAHLFKPHTATLWGPGRPAGGDRYGRQRFTGDPAPNGGAIYYSLGRDASEVSLRVLGADGETLATVQASTAAGFHRALWNLRSGNSGGQRGRGQRARGQRGAQRGAQRGGQRGGQRGAQRGAQRGRRGGAGQARGGRGGRGGGGGGAVQPGTYRVILTVDGQDFTQTITVEPDPGN